MRLEFWGVKLATLAMVIGSYGGVQGQERVGKMTIYYFPIGAETLTPITSANIQERGRHCEIRATAEIGQIKNVLRGAAKPGSQKFSDLAVRVKLLETSDAGDRLLAIVENEGEVRFPDGREGFISQKGLKTIKKLIEAQCRP